MHKPTTNAPATIKNETPEILAEGGGNGGNGRKKSKPIAGANPPRKFITMPPQVKWTLECLLEGDHTRREAEASHIGRTYEPNHIRTRFGLSIRTHFELNIRTDWRKVKTRDGFWTRMGVYWLLDIVKALLLLRGGE